MTRCGTGAVVLLWDMTLEVVSVNGDATSYYLDSTSHLVQEPDGVRVLGSTAHDLLQKVGLDKTYDKILQKWRFILLCFAATFVACGKNG